MFCVFGEFCKNVLWDIMVSIINFDIFNFYFDVWNVMKIVFCLCLINIYLLVGLEDC